METTKQQLISRPTVSEFDNPIEFIRAMLNYRKQEDRNFSVLQETKKLRRVSPALVSLILKGQRQLTFERVDEFAVLLKLSSSEKSYLKSWLDNKQDPGSKSIAKPVPNKNRKQVSQHILQDWLNVYVKDCFENESVQAKPELVFHLLSTLANKPRIEKSLGFLLREGYLRKTLEGKIVPDVPLTVVDPNIPSEKIRAFHKAALKLAINAIDIHNFQERYANTLILSMNEENYQNLLGLIQDFAEKLQNFASESKGPKMYQVIINASPTGGKVS